MLHLEANILVFFLLLSFFFEGIGVPFGRETAFFIILFLPLFLSLRVLVLKQKIVLPISATYLFISFLFFSALSTAFSLNAQKSFEYFIYLVALFTIFLYTYNNKKDFEKKLVSLIFILSIFYATYSIIASTNLHLIPAPLSGYQFIFPTFTSHNHLGDFLALPITICIYYLFNRRHILRSCLFIAYSLPFVFFSYSRSAYLSIAGGTLFLYFFSFLKKHSWKYKLIFLIFTFGIIFFAIFFYIVTISSKQIANYSIPQNINKFLIEKEGLNKYKDVFGNRLNYSTQGILSVANRPLLGVGPFNFEYSSNKFTKNPLYGTTSSSHNIFLDIATEHGLIALIVFTAFIILVFSRSKKNVLYFVALVMFINFQTDYTYRIYSFLLLFFVITGTIYTEKKEKEISIKLLLIAGISLSLFAFAILLSNFLQINNHNKEAFYLYPLNEKVYIPLINDERNSGNYKKALAFSNAYENLFSGDYLTFENLGHIYENFSDKKNTLYYYGKTLSLNFFKRPYLIKKIYYLKKEIEGKKSADDFIFESLKRLDALENSSYISPEFIKNFYNNCIDAKIICPKLSH